MDGRTDRGRQHTCTLTHDIVSGACSKISERCLNERRWGELRMYTQTQTKYLRIPPSMLYIHILHSAAHALITLHSFGTFALNWKAGLQAGKRIASFGKRFPLHPFSIFKKPKKHLPGLLLPLYYLAKILGRAAFSSSSSAHNFMMCNGRL